MAEVHHQYESQKRKSYNRGKFSRGTTRSTVIVRDTVACRVSRDTARRRPSRVRVINRSRGKVELEGTVISTGMCKARSRSRA